MFQFTHPGKGATPSLHTSLGDFFCFNSRTLGRVRHGRLASRHLLECVSIHAPWEGCDGYENSPKDLKWQFQFTHPGKGATSPTSPSYPSRTFQFTHPGKGATVQTEEITTGEDSFNSRTLGRVRQEYPQLQLFAIGVSIHAPWEGCDYSYVTYYVYTTSFNSRTLGRVRRRPPRQLLPAPAFQFTHPGKGATRRP